MEGGGREQGTRQKGGGTMHRRSNRPAATATYCAMVLPVVCLPRPQKITLQGIRRHKTSAREAGQESARESACPFPKCRIWVRALERRGRRKGPHGAHAAAMGNPFLVFAKTDQRRNPIKQTTIHKTIHPCARAAATPSPSILRRSVRWRRDMRRL